MSKDSIVPSECKYFNFDEFCTWGGASVEHKIDCNIENCPLKKEGKEKPMKDSIEERIAEILLTLFPNNHVEEINWKTKAIAELVKAEVEKAMETTDIYEKGFENGVKVGAEYIKDNKGRQKKWIR